MSVSFAKHFKMSVCLQIHISCFSASKKHLPQAAHNILKVQCRNKILKSLINPRIAYVLMLLHNSSLDYKHRVVFLHVVCHLEFSVRLEGKMGQEVCTDV